MKAISPTGSEIRGTLETVSAVAEISHFERGADGALVYDHSGESEIFWDGMQTEVRDGKTIFLDHNGEEWTEDQITLVPDDE